MLRGLKHGRTGVSQLLAVLAFIAIATRALVPAGYMFAPPQDGRILTVTLCSGHGAVEALLDLSTGQLVDQDDVPDNTPEKNAPRADAPCVFATVATLAAPEQALAFSSVFVMAVADHLFIVSVAPGQGLAAPPPWSTGPPYTL